MATSQRTPIGRWLRPLFIGTLLGGWTFATVGSFFLRLPEWLSWVPHIGLVKWLAFMLVLTIMAFTHALVFTLVDVTLLKLKVRVLPSGRTAWASAFLAPLAVGIGLRVWPGLGYHVGAWLAAAFALMGAVSTALRVGWGKAPD